MIVLAGLLAVRQGVGRITTEIAAEEPPPSTIPQQPADSLPEQGGSSGFGDLPPSRQQGGGADDEPPADEREEPEPDEEPADGSDQESDGGEGNDPPPTPEIEPLDCPAGVDPVICDAAEFVQRTRGRPFKSFPVVELLPDDQFDTELLSDFEEYRGDLDVDDATLTALGLLNPDLSLAEIFRDSLEVGVVGFYDPDDGQLVVRGQDLGLYTQLVLVHELTHAFDDQWFDLGRAFDDDDHDYGFSAVIEGNASRVEALWRDELTALEESVLAREESSTLSAEDIDRLLALPAVVLDLQASPYVDGEVYVRSLVGRGGEAAIDEGLTTPPSTSEEVLHPGLDRSVDREVIVAAPPADGDIVDGGRLGELMIEVWLGPLAAEGWGGDRYVTWEANGLDCIRVDMIGDNAQDNAELAAAAGAWAGARSESRTFESVDIDGRQGGRITACH